MDPIRHKPKTEGRDVGPRLVNKKGRESQVTEHGEQVTALRKQSIQNTRKTHTAKQSDKIRSLIEVKDNNVLPTFVSRRVMLQG